MGRFLHVQTRELSPPTREASLVTSLTACVTAAVIASTLISCKKAQLSSDATDLARGERVVVEISEAQFVEGQVLGLDDAKIRVQTVNDGDQLRVDRSDVSRTNDTLLHASPRQYAICEWQPHQWVGCQIEGVDAQSLQVLSLQGERESLDSSRVLRASVATSQSQARLFEAARARGRFEFEARAAGPPHRPAGWHPAVGDSVVARRGNNWINARVIRDTDGGVQVSWAGDDGVGNLRSADVMPSLLVSAVPPAVGSFVLVRGTAVPQHDPNQWLRGRVEAANDTEVIIADRDGKRHRVALRDVVPLAH